MKEGEKRNDFYANLENKSEDISNNILKQKYEELV